MIAHRTHLAAPVVVAAVAGADMDMLAASTVVRWHWHHLALVVLRHDAFIGQVGEVSILVDLEAFLILASAEHVYPVAGLAYGFYGFAASRLVSRLDLRRVQVAIGAVLFDIASVVEHYALALSIVQAHAAPHDLLQKAYRLGSSKDGDVRNVRGIKSSGQDANVHQVLIFASLEVGNVLFSLRLFCCTGDQPRIAWVQAGHDLFGVLNSLSKYHRACCVLGLSNNIGNNGGCFAAPALESGFQSGLAVLAVALDLQPACVVLRCVNLASAQGRKESKIQQQPGPDAVHALMEIRIPRNMLGQRFAVWVNAKNKTVLQPIRRCR